MRYNTRMDIYRKCDLAAGDSVTVSRQGRVTAYTLRNAGGSGIVEAHELFEGAQVLYDDMHLNALRRASRAILPLRTGSIVAVRTILVYQCTFSKAGSPDTSFR